jgi:Ca2+-binding RTX toxin-like protein
MLLGGAGSDTIYGGPGDDVIWGDRLPSPNGVDADDFTGSPTRWTFE